MSDYFARSLELLPGQMLVDEALTADVQRNHLRTTHSEAAPSCELSL